MAAIKNLTLNQIAERIAEAYMLIKLNNAPAYRAIYRQILAVLYAEFEKRTEDMNYLQVLETFNSCNHE
jgi:hypothetical protein